MILIRYVVIINNYLEKYFFSLKRKQEESSCFKSLNSPVFTTVAYRLKSTKRKEKINLDTIINHNFIK